MVAGDVFRYDFTKSALPEAEITFLDPPYRFLREQPDRVRALAEQLAQTRQTELVTLDMAIPAWAASAAPTVTVRLLTP